MALNSAAIASIPEHIDLLPTLTGATAQRGWVLVSFWSSHMKVLVFNDLKFLPRGVAVTPGYHGTYSANASRGFHLYKPSGQLEAYIVNNPQQGRFVVTASITRGVPRYMFSTCSLTEEWLNMTGMGLLLVDELVAKIRFETSGQMHFEDSSSLASVPA
jgi:hypothetical protein